MQVPFGTSLEFPHSLHIQPKLGFALLGAKTGARAPRFSARSRRRRGRGGRSDRRRV